MVIDGGNAMAQQRGTQNAADSAALAGALVIAQKFGGQNKGDSDVVNAMNNAFSQNAIDGQRLVLRRLQQQCRRHGRSRRLDPE